MRLRDEYIKFRTNRIDQSFDEEGDRVFMSNYFGSNPFKIIMKELIEMQGELDRIEERIDDED